MAAPFQFLIDTPQLRIKTLLPSGPVQESLSTFCGAQDWDIASSTNCYLDGISGTVMLTPGPKMASWIGTNTGPTSKLALTDFTLNDPTNWVANTLVMGDGPFYSYQAANTTTGGVGGLTNATFSANQGFFLEWFQDQGNANPNGVMLCGWNTTNSGAVGPSLRFYGDGRFEVWLDGTMVGTYSISGKSAKYGQTDDALTGQSGPQYVGVMLIPCRERELLVLSTQGGGAVHIFDSIPEGTVSPIITPATNFWFSVPGGTDTPTTPNVRVSPMQYATSGILVGKQSFWRFDPGASPVGGFSNWLAADLSFGTPTCSVAVNDGVNPAIPYANNTNGVRLALTLTGSSYGGYASTPFVFGARGYTTTQTLATASVSTDLTGFVSEGAHLDVSDSISGLHGEIELYSPTAILAAGCPDIDLQSNRPVQVKDEAGIILDGTFNAPKKIYSTVHASSPEFTQTLERVHGELKDRWKTADNFMFTEPIPLDGMALNAAYALLCSIMGLSCNVSASLTYQLPDAGNPTISSEFNVLVKPGDKGSEWLDRLHKTYCGTAFHGIAGLDYGAGTAAGTFQLIDPADMPGGPFCTLYDGATSATAGGAPTDGTAYFRSFDAQQIEPEANDIYVVGYDFRQKRPLVYHTPDYASMAPATAPNLRPANWLGEPRKYSWIDASLTTIQACQYVGDLLFQRLTQQRQLIEFEAEYQPGLVRGQMVKLVGSQIPGGSVVARIRTLNVSFDHTATDAGYTIWRPVRYVAQIGQDISALHSYGTTLHAIVQDAKNRSYSKNQYITDEDQAKVWARPFLNALAA